MPQVNSESLVLLVAAGLMVVGLIGLAPNALQVLRRRRLVAQLGNLKVDEDAAREMFAPLVVARGVEAPVEPLSGAAEVGVAGAAYVGQPAAAARTEPLPAPAATGEGAAATVVEAALEQEEQPAAADGPPPADSDEAGETESGDEDEEEDDMLALFRETKLQSSTPAALSEGLERVTAADLLAQAREIRDLLRRAA